MDVLELELGVEVEVEVAVGVTGLVTYLPTFASNTAAASAFRGPGGSCTN